MEHKIEDVPTEVIEYFVKDEGMAEEGIEKLSDKEKEDIIEWFSSDIYATEKFGNQMIKWIKADVDNIDSVEKIQEIYNKYYEEPITVEDNQILVKEDELPDNSEVETRIESVLEQYNIDSLKEIAREASTEAPWVVHLFKKEGIDITNRQLYTDVFRPVYYKVAASKVEAMPNQAEDIEQTTDVWMKHDTGGYVKIDDSGNTQLFDVSGVSQRVGHIDAAQEEIVKGFDIAGWIPCEPIETSEPIEDGMEATDETPMPERLPEKPSSKTAQDDIQVGDYVKVNTNEYENLISGPEAEGETYNKVYEHKDEKLWVGQIEQDANTAYLEVHETGEDIGWLPLECLERQASKTAQHEDEMPDENRNPLPSGTNWDQFAKEFDIGTLDLDVFASFMGYANFDELEISISPRALYEKMPDQFLDAIKESSLMASRMDDYEIEKIIAEASIHQAQDAADILDEFIAYCGTMNIFEPDEDDLIEFMDNKYPNVQQDIKNRAIEDFYVWAKSPEPKEESKIDALGKSKTITVGDIVKDMSTGTRSSGKILLVVKDEGMHNWEGPGQGEMKREQLVIAVDENKMEYAIGADDLQQVTNIEGLSKEEMDLAHRLEFSNESGEIMEQYGSKKYSYKNLKQELKEQSEGE